MKPSQMETILTLDSIDRFRNSLFVGGKADHTVKAYTTDLRVFLNQIEETGISLEELEETASRWLTGTRRKVSPKTTNRRITSLRAYGKWSGCGTILEDYKAPTPAKGDPHPLPEGTAGVRRLIECTANEKQRALIALCGLCGLRVSEARSIRPSSIDMHRMVLTIRGKGDKTRRVPISTEAWSILQVPVLLAMVDDDNFVVDLADRFARSVITNLGRKAGLQRPISSHDLRATFGTAVYDKTLDIRLVQTLLGHASSETTELYIGVKDENLKKAVEL